MKPHFTAIRRKALSAPARHLQSKNLVVAPALDYGCGRGKDMEILGCDGYDPHWAPVDLSEHTGAYQTILCTYVLNVVPEGQQADILTDILRRLAPGGVAYIAVRRDTAEMREQRLVRLPLPVLRETSRLCIYEMQKSPGPFSGT